uniref:hypothetical protein n=1 Tax=Faecalibacterium sp. TaxID=1971605 RepID=UPI003FEDC611
RRQRCPRGQWFGFRLLRSTKNSSVVMTLEFLFYLNFYKAPQGWIRTAAALSRKTAQKQPGGLFLAARLA